MKNFAAELWYAVSLGSVQVVSCIFIFIVNNAPVKRTHFCFDNGKYARSTTTVCTAQLGTWPLPRHFSIPSCPAPFVSSLSY
jgi:hypothetical protein